MDIVDSVTRSKMMSGIKNMNTKPERLVCSELQKHGFHFKLHNVRLPGKPDIVLPRYAAIIMINGCFWHGHECDLFKWPTTRSEFWRAKIGSNRERDKRNIEALLNLNWRVGVIWECALRKNRNQNLPKVTNTIIKWLTGNEKIKVVTLDNINQENKLD